VTSQGLRFNDSKYCILSFLSNPIHRLIITSPPHHTIYLINASTSSSRYLPKECEVSIENANKTLSARPKSYTYSPEKGKYSTCNSYNHHASTNPIPQHRLGPIHFLPPNTHQSKNPLTIPRPSRLKQPFPRPTRHTSNSRHHPTRPHNILPNIDADTRSPNLAKTLCA
jgi:hypothetical protein